jgi:hypothetical protein
MINDRERDECEQEPLQIAMRRPFEFPVGVGLLCVPNGGYWSHFPFAFNSVGSWSSSTFLFWLNAKPINPNTTKTAPATIIQCGNCIAVSIIIPAE